MSSAAPLPGDSAGEGLARALMFVAPAMFAANILIARAAADSVPPVALAVGRWTMAALILLPFVGQELWAARGAIRRELGDLFILGVLGMGVCGAVVYLGAATTTATNMGIIFSAAPVIIIVLARWFYGEAMSSAQLFGVALSLGGVLVIVTKGEAGVLLGLRFAPGDLYILVAVFSWAVYSVLLRHRRTALAPTLRFAASAILGTLAMLPFLALESALYWAPRIDTFTISAMLLLAVVPGLGAYQAYAFIQTRLGANRTSLMLYLVPIYSAGLAWALLGEQLRLFHFIGASLALAGIYLATRRGKTNLRRRP